MKKVFLPIVIIISLLLVFSFISGCNIKEQSIAKTTAEETKQISSDVSESSETILEETVQSSPETETVVTEEETTEETTATTIPQDWPDVIPVNSNIVINFASAEEVDGKYTATVSGIYSGEAADIYNYYKEQFSGLDIDEYEQEWDDGSIKNTIQASKDGFDIAVSVTKSDDGVDVTLWVQKQ